jgi:CDGSH-type Zn-finger protein
VGLIEMQLNQATKSVKYDFLFEGETMEQPIIAKNSPYAVEIESGKKYWWCCCGRSKQQPFCDGSHQGTGIEPVAFTAEQTETIYLCGCKQTANKPFCDGTHNKL